MLAAGAGTRLRPLTPTLPKALAPVGGRPVVLRLLERLEEAALNVHHGAELIRRVVEPRAICIHEPWLRGTAGALAGAAEFLAGADFMVASADGVHDVDFQALQETHVASGAVATITVKRIARPETCAIVELDAAGQVRRFVEKPLPDAVFTDLASIGIYCFKPEVLGLIPDDRPYDIAGELIPALLDAGLPVASYETDASWSDIGDPAELLAANLRLGFVAEDCDVASDAVLQPPVMVGPNCVIGAGARVTGSLVLPGSVVPAGSHVVGTIHGDPEDVLRTWLR